jgi:hypothetical protein
MKKSVRPFASVLLDDRLLGSGVGFEKRLDRETCESGIKKWRE